MPHQRDDSVRAPWALIYVAIMAVSVFVGCKITRDEDFALKDVVSPTSGPARQEIAIECSKTWTLFLSPKQRDLLHDIDVSSGAVGPNVPGSPASQEVHGKWFIEYQRRGFQLVLAGICLKNTEYLETGLKVFRWGFDRQGADGGFMGSGDAFHSTTFFIEAVAHSILIVRAADSVTADMKNRFEALIPNLSRATTWLIRPDVLAQGLANNDAYSHRRLLVGEGFALVSLLAAEQKLAVSLKSLAGLQIKEAIDLQRPDGVVPEKGGYDSSYQAVGMGFAVVWWLYFQDDPLAPAVKEFLEKGLNWEMSRILPTGEVDKTGNTRVTGTGEVGRTGKPKDIDYPRVAHALGVWGAISANFEMISAARRVCHFKYPDRCRGP